MKPKNPPCEDPQGDLFKVELETIIDRDHAMVKLAQGVNWSRLEETFGAYYCDEGVVAGWVENPYWQYLSGMKHFEHRRPIDPSSMTHWRKRVGAAGAEAMSQETEDHPGTC